MAGRDESAPSVVRSCLVDRPPSQLPNADRTFLEPISVSVERSACEA